MILEYIAQDLVENTTKILGYPLSITDEEGYIIASTDPSRIGVFHPASLDVIKRNDLISYTEKDVQHLENVLPGVASPIVFNDKIIGVLGVVGDPSEVRKYVQLVRSHVELMCQEMFKKEMAALESKTMETFVQYIIQSGNKENYVQLIRYAKLLGYNLELSRICVLIDIDMLSINFSANKSGLDALFSSQYFQQELLTYIEYIFKDNQEDIICFLNVEQVIILKVVDAVVDMNLLMETMREKLQNLDKYLTNNYKLKAVISLGEIHKGIQGIRASYQHAVQALTAGKQTTIEPRVYAYHDWQIMIEILVRELSEEVKNKLTTHFSFFMNQDNFSILADTFMMYCACNLNLSETARSLYIHRNTLVYRLEKICKLTSLDLNKFEQCLLLYITIKNHVQTTENWLE